MARLDRFGRIANPADPSEDLARLSDAQMGNFLERLKSFLDLAARATARDTALAADVWQEAFEYLFPIPDVTEQLTEQGLRRRW